MYRNKKKLEGEINELEIALDHSNKANSEAQKSIKRYQVIINMFFLHLTMFCYLTFGLPVRVIMIKIRLSERIFPSLKTFFPINIAYLTLVYCLLIFSSYEINKKKCASLSLFISLSWPDTNYYSNLNI